MSEPVNDLPKQRVKKRTPVYVRQQSAQTAAINAQHNKVLLDKVETLQSFTQDTMNAVKQDQERGSGACRNDPNHDSAELLKILDETHQQFRNNILKAANAGRQGSISSIGNRDSPAPSDYDTDTEVKPRRLEPAKKVVELKKPEAKKVAEKPNLSDDMLFLKIDHSHSAETQEILEKNLHEVTDIYPTTPTITATTLAGLELRESRSTPMLLDLNPIKELEIIEEQNEQDNQSDCGEGTSLIEDEIKADTDQPKKA
jgi:hypothetical protein